MVVNPNYEGLDWQVQIVLTRLLKENDTNVPSSFIALYACALRSNQIEPPSIAMVKYKNGSVEDRLTLRISPDSLPAIEQFVEDLPLVVFDKKHIPSVLLGRPVINVIPLARIAELYSGRYVVGTNAYSFESVCNRFSIECKLQSMSVIDYTEKIGDLLSTIAPILKIGKQSSSIRMEIISRSFNKQSPQKY